MTSSRKQIPQFSLEGEQNWFDDPQFVHLEDIASRSREREWVINPHRHTRLYQILLLEHGEASVTLDTEQFNLAGHWAILIPAGIVHSFRFAPNTVGKVLSIAETLIINNHAAMPAALHTTLLSTPTCLSFTHQEDCFSSCQTLVNLLQTEFNYPQVGRTTMIENLLGSLLIQLQRLQDSLPSHNSDDSLALRIKQLIHTHFREHWSVQDYASALNVGEKKLTRATQKAFGRTVKELSLERLHLEAKRQLVYTQKSIEEISHDLGYADFGYFCRSFKRLEGKTPAQYRQAAFTL